MEPAVEIDPQASGNGPRPHEAAELQNKQVKPGDVLAAQPFRARAISNMRVGTAFILSVKAACIDAWGGKLSGEEFGIQAPVTGRKRPFRCFRIRCEATRRIGAPQGRSAG